MRTTSLTLSIFTLPIWATDPSIRRTAPSFSGIRVTSFRSDNQEQVTHQCRISCFAELDFCRLLSLFTGFRRPLALFTDKRFLPILNLSLVPFSLFTDSFSLFSGSYKSADIGVELSTKCRWFNAVVLTITNFPNERAKYRLEGVSRQSL